MSIEYNEYRVQSIEYNEYSGIAIHNIIQIGMRNGGQSV
jgi:hypothetical protein